MDLSLLQPTTPRMADQNLFISPSVGLVHTKICISMNENVVLSMTRKKKVAFRGKWDYEMTSEILQMFSFLT